MAWAKASFAHQTQAWISQKAAFSRDTVRHHGLFLVFMTGQICTWMHWKLHCRTYTPHSKGYFLTNGFWVRLSLVICYDNRIHTIEIDAVMLNSYSDLQNIFWRIYDWESRTSFQNKREKKNPANRRHWLSQRVRIIAPIQFI